MRAALTRLARPVRAGWDLWSRFWFDPIPAARLGLLRIWLFGFVVRRCALAQGSVGRTRRHTAAVLASGRCDLGAGPTRRWSTRCVADLLVQAVLAVPALLAALGYRYRFSAPVAARALPLLAVPRPVVGRDEARPGHADSRPAVPLGRLRRAEPLARLAGPSADLGCARSAVVGRTPVDELSSNGAWAVRAIQVALAALYFLSGYAKLRSVGIDWIWGDTLQQAIQDKASSGETTELGFWVLRRRWIDGRCSKRYRWRGRSASRSCSSGDCATRSWSSDSCSTSGCGPRCRSSSSVSSPASPRSCRWRNTNGPHAAASNVAGRRGRHADGREPLRHDWERTDGTSYRRLATVAPVAASCSGDSTTGDAAGDEPSERHRHPPLRRPRRPPQPP